MPSLDIVIVNWNAGDQLRQCLASIPAAVHGPVMLGAVVVVDNASTDGSAEGLDVPGVPLRVVRNEQNLGFAAACNQGAREGRADYILFLNPDTELYSDSLVVPMRYAGAHPQVGVVGIALQDESGAVARNTASFPSPRSIVGSATGLNRLLPATFRDHFNTDWDHAHSREVDQVMGAFFWLRRDRFERVGGFDERFFVYYEEVDLSRRLFEAGYPSVFLVEARAFHKGGGTSDKAKAARLFYALRSRILYGHKHFPPAVACALAALTLFAEPFTRLAYLAARGDHESACETLAGYRMLWRSAPSLLLGSVCPTS